LWVATVAQQGVRDGCIATRTPESDLEDALREVDDRQDHQDHDEDAEDRHEFNSLN
jgi:hypothetical protein